MTRHLLNMADFGADEVRAMLTLGAADPASLGAPLAGRGAALIFEKPSNRTRQSMEMAVFQLGGHPVYTRGEEIGIDVREPATDVVKILQGYHAVIAARDRKYVIMNAPAPRLPELEALLPALESPTVIPLAHAGMIAIHSVVGADDVWGLLPRLKSAGASGILVLPIEKIVP